MPTYDYECRSCGHSFETFQSMSDDSLTTCPDCGKEQLRRLIGGGSAIIFKGSGFYVNDSRSKNSATASSAGNASGNSSASASGSKPGAGEKPAPAKSDSTKTKASA